MDNLRNSHLGETMVMIPKTFAIDEVDKFRREVYQLIESGKKNFVLNFQQCEFIDSTGLGVLVAIYKKCIELNGNLKLHAVHGNVERIFKLTRLDKVFHINE